MRRYIPLVLTVVLAALGVLALVEGGALLVALGIVLLLLALGSAALSLVVLRGPEATLERLQARRRTLEAQAGRAPATEASDATGTDQDLRT